jgi:hypothetical protein
MEGEKALKVELEKYTMFTVSVVYNGESFPFGLVKKQKDSSSYVLQTSAFNYPRLSSWLRKMRIYFASNLKRSPQSISRENTGTYELIINPSRL